MNDGIYIDIDIQCDGGVLAMLIDGIEKLDGWTVADNVMLNVPHRFYRLHLEDRWFSWYTDDNCGKGDEQVVIYAKQVADILTFIREKGHLFIGIEVPVLRYEYLKSPTTCPFFTRR